MQKLYLEEKGRQRISEAQGTTSPPTTANKPGSSSVIATSPTPLDTPGPSRVPTAHSISPKKQLTGKRQTTRTKKGIARKTPPPKKTAKTTIQNKAKTSKKMTKTKLAALRQSQAFAENSRSKLDVSKIASPQTRKYKVKASTPNTRDHKIPTSSAPAEFMISSMQCSSSIVQIKSHSPTPTEPPKMVSCTDHRKAPRGDHSFQLPLSSTQMEPEVMDLIETFDSTFKEMTDPEISITPQTSTQPDISIVPPTVHFGQSCTVLSSDSQESVNNFHTATHSIVQLPERISFQPEQPLEPEHQAMKTEHARHPSTPE